MSEIKVVPTDVCKCEHERSAHAPNKAFCLVYNCECSKFDPAEQAAPPRPLSELTKRIRANQASEPTGESYIVHCPSLNEKSAAIEQARPQPPDFLWMLDKNGWRHPENDLCAQEGCTPESPQDWAYSAAEKIHALFNNASYFSTRNAEHRKQMLEGWAEIIRAARAVAVPEPAHKWSEFKQDEVTACVKCGLVKLAWEKHPEWVCGPVLTEFEVIDRVPEPAAQQESDKGETNMNAPQTIDDFVDQVTYALTSAGSEKHETRLLRLKSILSHNNPFARQAEPAPTPSRPNIETYIARIMQKIKAYKLMGNYVVALEEIELVCDRFYKDAAEARSLGTKEE